MKKTLFTLFTVINLVLLYCPAALALTEDEAAAAVDAQGKDAVSGNLCQKHLRKLDKGLQTYYNQQICKIKDILSETYPTRLSLPQQGSFDLGYYHQTQKRYTKKEDK